MKVVRERRRVAMGADSQDVDTYMLQTVVDGKVTLGVGIAVCESTHGEIEDTVHEILSHASA